MPAGLREMNIGFSKVLCTFLCHFLMSKHKTTTKFEPLLPNNLITRKLTASFSNSDKLHQMIFNFIKAELKWQQPTFLF